MADWNEDGGDEKCRDCWMDGDCTMQAVLNADAWEAEKLCGQPLCGTCAAFNDKRICVNVGGACKRLLYNGRKCGAGNETMAWYRVGERRCYRPCPKPEKQEALF